MYTESQKWKVTFLQSHQLEGVNDVSDSFSNRTGDKVPFERALSYLSDQLSVKRKLYIKCFSLGKYNNNLLRQSPTFMTHYDTFEFVDILTKSVQFFSSTKL